MPNNTNNLELNQMKLTTLLLRQMPSELSSGERWVLIALSGNFTSIDTPISVSVKTLEADTAIKSRTIIKHLGTLAEKGYIKKNRIGQGEINEYWIDLINLGIDCEDFRHRKTRESNLKLVVNH